MSTYEVDGYCNVGIKNIKLRTCSYFDPIQRLAVTRNIFIVNTNNLYTFYFILCLIIFLINNRERTISDLSIKCELTIVLEQNKL